MFESLSFLDLVMLFWVVPTLITFLLTIRVELTDEGTESIKVEDIDNYSWKVIIICAIIYPLGVAAFTQYIAWPWLTKERHFKK